MKIKYIALFLVFELLYLTGVAGGFSHFSLVYAAPMRRLLAQDAPPPEAPPPTDTAAPADTTDTPAPPDQSNTDEFVPEESAPAPESPEQVPAGEAQPQANPNENESPTENAPPEFVSPGSPEETQVNQTSDDVLVSPETQGGEVGAQGEQSPQPAPAEQISQSPQQALPATETQEFVEKTIDLDQSFVNTERVNSEIVQKSEIEESQLANVDGNPREESSLLLQFANEKVDDIEQTLQAADFSTTNFVSQRLNDQIDSFEQNYATLSPEERQGVLEQLSTFTANAEHMLRSQQLVVPEGLEQDLEISRGKILSLHNEL